MSGRRKVIFGTTDGWHEEFHLALTNDQIKLLRWLLDNDIINCEWKMQVLEEATVWKEI